MLTSWPLSRMRLSASTSATNAPVIDAVRVPPSAWITSQSTQIVRSPSASRRVTDRRDRPISRWISCVRPPTFPAVDSRCVRVEVARGSMPYSAVTQPLPLLRRNGGTLSSMLALQMTRVFPTSISTDPSAWIVKSGVMVVRRSSSGERSFRRLFINQTFIFPERAPQVHMTRQRIHFLAADQDLHVLQVRQVGEQRVDDRVHGHQLLQGAAGVRGPDRGVEIDECLVA